MGEKSETEYRKIEREGEEEEHRPRRRAGSKSSVTFILFREEKEEERQRGFLFWCLFPPPFSSSFAGCRIRNIHIYIHNSNNNTALNAFDNSVIFRSSECFVCWLSARVCAEEVGGSSLCSLKGKYKARTKLGAQAGKTAGKAREGKVVGIC